MMPKLNIPLKLYSEGKVSFYSTDLDYLRELGLAYTKAPVFYNPKMKLNRDVTVSLFASLSLKTAADLMAASGVRALRLAAEGNAQEVLANDSSCLSAHIIKMNARLNGLSNIKVSCSDARLMAEKISWEGYRTEYVDLDPFGSPAPYIDSFLRAVKRGGVIGITATDTPPLFGLYPDKLFRFYGVWGNKFFFHKEFGIRALIYFVVRTAARFDLAAKPILSYGREHYVRTFFQLEKGASASSDLLKNNMGWIEYLNGDFNVIRGKDLPVRRNNIVGPIWVSSTSSMDLIRKIRPINDETSNLLAALTREAEGPPLYYLLDDICSAMRTRVPKIDDVILKLRELGYFACRTHLEPLGIKTDASRKELENVVRELTAS